MANVIIDVAAEFTGKKAFKDAGNATSSLEKSVKTLGKTIGITFSAKAIVDFSKASVKAFAEDDRAIRVLRTNLKNLGLAYQSANADNFIASMEKQAAISDDLLRPAYAQLSKVTLSTTKTQDLMALAFDVSAANGIDFASTVDILSNAYVGNYKGLKQLYTGLTQAQLASKSFEEIQAILTKQSKGAGKASIDTYAGSVEKLSIAADNAKESIGKGLVDLFADLAGNGDINQATSNIDSLSKALGQLLTDANQLSLLDQVLFFVTGQISEKTEAKLFKRPSARRFFTGGSGVSTELLAARKQAEADAKAKKAAAALAAAKIKADKLAAANKLKLEKASAVFNMQNIQINAALKGRIGEEEKTRLLLMQAIADEDATKAEKLQKKLEEIQAKNAEIAKSLTEISTVTDPFAAWATSLGAAATVLKAMPALINASGGLTSRGTHNIPTGDGLPVSGETAGVTVIVPTAGATTGATAPINPILGGTTSVPAAIAADPVITAVVSDSVVTAITDGITEAASGTGGFGWSLPSYITDTFATGIVDSIGESLVAASNIGSTGGFGFSLPGYLSSSIPTPTATPVVINVTNTGSVIMQDEFVTAVADALITANTNGNNNYRPGAILIDG